MVLPLNTPTTQKQKNYVFRLKIIAIIKNDFI